MRHRLKNKAKHKLWYRLNYIRPSGKWDDKPLYIKLIENGKRALYYLECGVCHGFGSEYRYWDSALDKESGYYKPNSSGYADLYNCRQCGGRGYTDKAYRVRNKANHP